MVTMNREKGSVDLRRMGAGADLSQGVWVVLAALIAATVISMLYTVACAVRNERYLHDLRVSVFELRGKYIRELRRLHGLDPEGGDDPNEIIEVGGVDDEPPMVVSRGEGAGEGRKAA